MIELKDKSPEALAAEIVLLPDGYSFSSLKEEKELAGLLTVARDPLRYAEIFAAVRKHRSASAWMQLAARAEEVNGRRRAKGADAPQLATDLDRIAREAEQTLPGSREKYALLANVRYNEGILNRQPRTYSQGADAQRLASAWYGLAGNTEMQYTCLFVAAVEDVSAAFCSGDDGALRYALRALVAAGALIEAQFSGYPEWMFSNAPTHISSAIVLANLMRDGLYPEDYSRHLLEASKTDMVHWNKFFAVWNDFSESRFSDVAVSLPSEVESSSLDNARLSVQVVVALAERNLGKNDEAKARLERVANHAGPDGGMPIAVAKRLLA